MKKYELTDETLVVDGHTLYKIRALRSFSNVREGDLGGWIENESNLSHEGDCWIADNARVYGNTRVFGKAQVFGDASIYDNTQIYGNTRVFGYAHVYGNAQVFDNSKVFDTARIYGNALVYGNVNVSGYAWVCGDALVYGKSKISGNCILKFNNWIQLKDITLDHGVWTDSYIIGNEKYIVSNTLEQLYIENLQ